VTYLLFVCVLFTLCWILDEIVCFIRLWCIRYLICFCFFFYGIIGSMYWNEMHEERVSNVISYCNDFSLVQLSRLPCWARKFAFLAIVYMMEYTGALLIIARTTALFVNDIYIYGERDMLGIRIYIYIYQYVCICIYVWLWWIQVHIMCITFLLL